MVPALGFERVTLTHVSTAPIITSVALTTVDDQGRLSRLDTIVVTFSAAMRVSSFFDVLHLVGRTINQTSTRTTT